jgi:glycosyltransferase involved in cell wall biosynthesis
MWDDEPGATTYEDTRNAENVRVSRALEREGAPAEKPLDGRPRSVLFVSWRDLANPLAGGSELLVHRLAAGMAERGYTVGLLCGGPIQPKTEYRIANSGGTYMQYVRAPFEYLRSFRSTDLVVEVCNGMPFLTPLWRRKATLCFVNHVHTDQWSSRFNPFVSAIGRRIEADVMPWVQRKNLVVTISDSTRTSLHEIGVRETQIRMIPQGVSEPPFLIPKSTSPHFVAVGRLVGYKRIDTLLEMWRSVQRITGGTLTIIGDGPARPRLEAMHVENVEFTGFISESEKHRLMCRALLLLHPASWEGWGLVITEAAARGTPAIGFDVPGVRDSIVNYETGLLASDRESFESHWIKLTRDEILRNQFAEAGMKRSMSAPWEETVDAFELVAAEAVCRHYARSRSGRYRAKHYGE